MYVKKIWLYACVKNILLAANRYTISDMNDFELIQSYLDGSIDEAARAAFEVRLKDDVELQAALRRAQNAQDLLSQVADYEQTSQASRDALQNVLNRREVEKAPRLGRPRVWLFAAAAGIALLVAVFWLMRPKPIDACAIFASSPEIDLLDQTKGAAPDAQTQLDDAQEAYREGKYQRVLDLLASFPKENEQYGFAQLLKGNALMGLCQPDSAITYLREAMNDESLAVRARWPLALAYMHVGNTDEAKAILNEMKKERYKQEEVRDLLERL